MTDNAHDLPRAAVFVGSSLQEAGRPIRVAPSLQSSLHAAVPTLCLGSVHVARNILETMHEALRMWRGRDRALLEDSSAVTTEQRGHMWWGMYQGRPLFFATRETAEKFRQCRMVGMFKDVSGGLSSVPALLEQGNKFMQELDNVQLPAEWPAPPPRYPYTWMDKFLASWQSGSERVTGVAAKLQQSVRWADLSALPGLGVPIPGAGVGPDSWPPEELQQLSALFTRFVSATCAQHALQLLRAQKRVQEVGPGVEMQVVDPNQLPDLGPSFRTGMVPLQDVLQLHLRRPPVLVCDEHDVAAATARPLSSNKNSESGRGAWPHVPAFRIAGLQLGVRQADGRLVSFLPTFLSSRHLRSAVRLCRTALQRNWVIQRHQQRCRQGTGSSGSRGSVVPVPGWLRHAWCEASWLADELALKSPWANQLVGLPDDVAVVPTTLEGLAAKIASANTEAKVACFSEAASRPALHGTWTPSTTAHHSQQQSDRTASVCDSGHPTVCTDSSNTSVLNAVWQLLAQDAWLLATRHRHQPQLPSTLLQVLSSQGEHNGCITFQARVLPLSHCDCGKQLQDIHPSSSAEEDEVHTATTSWSFLTNMPMPVSSNSSQRNGSRPQNDTVVSTRHLAAQKRDPRPVSTVSAVASLVAPVPCHVDELPAMDAPTPGAPPSVQGTLVQNKYTADLLSALPDQVANTGAGSVGMDLAQDRLGGSIRCATGQVHGTDLNKPSSGSPSANTPVESDIVAMFQCNGHMHNLDWHLCDVASDSCPADLVLQVNLEQLSGRQRDTALDVRRRPELPGLLQANQSDQEGMSQRDSQAPPNNRTKDAKDVADTGHFMDSYGMLLVGDLDLEQRTLAAAWPPSSLQVDVPFDLRVWVRPVTVSI